MTEHEQLSILSAEQLTSLEREIESAVHESQPRDLATQMRQFHGWTIDKLEILRLYLCGGYRRIAGGGTYIDGFAGQGQGEYRGAVHDGSAAIAATSDAFRTLYLIERDPGSHALLRQHLDQLPPRYRDRCDLRPPADCNVAIPALLDAGAIDRTKPCFAFLDPNSTELAWSTIERLAGYKTLRDHPDHPRKPIECKVELWILLNTHQAIYRLWPDDRERYPDTMSADTLDRLMGDRAAWWDLWQSGQKRQALVQRYCERLRELGYTYAIPQPIIDPQTRRVQYTMVHATDHPSAIGLMRWAKRQTGRVYASSLPGLDDY